MLVRYVTCAVVVLALSQAPALAQSSQSNAAGKNDHSAARAGSSETQAQTPQNLPQEIRNKLSQQGFTDIKVVPGSFLVSAKDKEGDPVNMVIGPHSMTMFSFISSEQQSTTASGKTDKTSGSTRK
jgi:hypothetical protein